MNTVACKKIPTSSPFCLVTNFNWSLLTCQQKIVICKENYRLFTIFYEYWHDVLTKH